MPFDFLRRNRRDRSRDSQVEDESRRKKTPDLREMTFEEGERALAPKPELLLAPTRAEIQAGELVGLGMEGPVVAEVLETLARLGFATAPTEVFDETTEATVLAFQRLYGLSVTGCVGSDTLMDLDRALASSVTLEQLIAILPHADKAFLAANLHFLNQSMFTGEMNTVERRATYIAQIAHESDRFRGLTEYASGNAYNGRRDLGNLEEGDGPRFKGRGAIHLTGRANYQAASDHFGVDFVTEPDLAAEPEWAFKIAEWYWSRHDLNRFADNGDFVTQTRRINGGTNGLADREQILAAARAVL